MVRLLLISLLASLISVLGDLSFSMIKRQFDIKDFGNIMPGHGGVLDRFDSVLFTPAVYLCDNALLPNLHVGDSVEQRGQMIQMKEGACRQAPFFWRENEGEGRFSSKKVA